MIRSLWMDRGTTFEWSLRLYYLIVFCWLLSYLKPFGLKNNTGLYVFQMVTPEIGFTWLHSYFQICVGYWLLSVQVKNFSLTSVIWFVAVYHSLQCVGILFTFHPHFLFLWAFSVTWHKYEWQFGCERKNNPSKEIAVPQPWIVAASALTSLPLGETLFYQVFFFFSACKWYTIFTLPVWGH